MNQQRRDNGRSAKLDLKSWLGVILFFGLGAAIARSVAMSMAARRAPIVVAFFYGAFAGGISASLVFYLLFNALRILRGKGKDHRS
jgi:hypothetical protein